MRMSLMKNGFTVLEIVIVIVILGLMAALAVPAYNKAKETAFDNQAKSDLKLIISSERNYKYEMTYYYPSSGSVTDINAINNNLSLTLSADNNRIWNYTVKSTGCGQATRYGGDARNWYMNATNTTTPISGTCP
jgi:prepilin-type N-terminal cleavage/methylation domain-containing protein